jgi:hypothetical protein
MGQTILSDGVSQRADDMLLAEHVSEGFGAIFAGEDLVTHAPTLGRVSSLARLL